MTTLSLEDLRRDEDVLRLPPSVRIVPDPKAAGYLREQRERAIAALGDKWVGIPKEKRA